MRTSRAFVMLAAGLAALAASGGCGMQNRMLGATGGVLLQGFDTLAYPHSTVTLSARLQGGDYLKGLEGYLVGFYEMERKVGESRTDEDGFAEIEYAAGGAGTKAVLAKLEDPDVRRYAVPAVEIVVAVREPSARMLVVDLDRTLVAGAFADVLADRARPIELSRQVLEQAAGDRTIVYLTHRPDIFTERSKEWLRRYDYPLGPLLVSTLSEFFRGSRSFKSAAIRDLKARYPGIETGIGDKAGDAEAYLANGMRAILLIHPQDMTRPEDVRRWIRDLKRLPEEVDVVESWAEAEQVLFGGARLPVSRSLSRLAKLHDRLIEELLRREAAPEAPGAGEGDWSPTRGAGGGSSPGGGP